ncbi:MAG: tetratricopeptide repeat protein [Prolixibacteraceae bacterium]
MSETKTKHLFDRSLTPAVAFSKRWLIGAGILLVFLVILAYSGAVRNNFVSWDDNEYVIKNKLVRPGGDSNLKDIFSTVVSSNYHPLTILSLRLNDNSCSNCPEGISPKPFIVGNILLHALNTILVFILIYFLFSRNLILAFFVAALFAVHPMHVESVAWISGRKDVLSSFFFLSGLISWYKYLNDKSRKYFWLALSFVLFILACLSKATAVVFPVIAILIWYLTAYNEDGNSSKTFLQKAFSSKTLLPLLPFFAASLFFGFMAVQIQGGENFLGLLKFSKEPDSVINIIAPFSWLQRTQIACYGFFAYLIKFVFPVNQSAFYPYPDVTEMNHGSFPVFLWLSLMAFIITSFLVVFSMKKTKLFVFSVGFYLIMLLLVLQFLSVGKAIMAERYTYLPYIGISIIPAWFISRYPDRFRKWLLIFAGFFILVMLLLTRKQVNVWYSTETLWSQAIENNPDQELAWRARGKYYYGKSSRAADPAERKILENKALSDFKVAISHKTASADVYEGMGVILQTRNEFKTALQLLNMAVRLNPKSGRTYYNRAIIFDLMNQKEEAIRDYDTALELDPKEALQIIRNRSVLYLETAKYEKALKDYDELIRLDQSNFSHYYNRAFSKVMLKDYDGAIADYQIVLKFNPGDKQTLEQIKVLIENIKKK